MEEMEVTPMPLDADDEENSGNINIVGVCSNSLITNEENYLLNPSVNTIAFHLENDNSYCLVNEGSSLEIKTGHNSSFSCQSETLPKFFDKIHLSNGMHSPERITDLKAENDLTGNETVKNCVESCKSGFHSMDDACPTSKSVTKSSNQCLTNVSSEKVQNVVCNTITNSTDFTTASHSEHLTIADNLHNNTQAIKDGTNNVICEMQTIQPCLSETVYDLSKTGTVKKECDIFGRPSQFDSLQKQPSEIKDRVMGFLAKYTIADEASCSGCSLALSVSKQECTKGSQSLLTNEKNIDSKIVCGEQSETINPKKISNDVTTQNTEEGAFARPHTSKFHLSSVAKNSFTEHISQTSNDCSPLNNVCTQHKDVINWQTICKDESALKTSDDVIESHECDNSLESNADVCSFQPNYEIKLNSFESEMAQNCQSFNLESNVKSISMCGSSGNNAKEINQQDKLNPDLSIDFMFPFSNDIIGNKMECCPSETHMTSPFLNAASVNRVTCTVQRSTNTDPMNSWLSWGKMSGELRTTPSINSPILSSKSGISNTSKHIPFSNNSFSLNIWPDNTELALKSGSKSRRTKSSDTMIYNIPKPFVNGPITFSSNGKGESQNCDNLSLVKAEEVDETNLFTSSFADCGNTSKVYFPSQHNINKNSHGMFENCLESSAYCASGKTLHSDYKCFEISFGNHLTKGSTENPFTKKPPVESIGLFRSAITSPVCEAENSVFKHASSLSFPVKKEKIEQSTGIEEVLGILKPATTNDPFDFSLGIKNKSDQPTHSSTEFAVNNLHFNESFTSKNKVSNCGKTSNDIGEQICVGNFERVPSQIDSNSSFQFTFTPEKSKTLCTSTVILPRTRKPMRVIRQFQKVTLKDVKGNIPSNVFGKGIEEISFKPVYGSDVKFEKGTYKNVIVRYQNIAVMDNYTNVSPEELRSQFYTKADVTGPFKFGACVEPYENLSNGFKKKQNQEIQTDEQLSSKNLDLTAIWRVLECPICLDVVLPPVYQCEQGHHACATCWTNVLTCPLCKRPQSCTRNYMAEALIEQVPLPCRYHIEGCKETVQHNSKVNHEENCSYRMYQCPVPMCNQALSFQNMCKHFKKHHKNILHHEGHSVGKGEKFCDVLYKEALLSSLVHAFNITKWGLFFLREVAVGCSTAFFVQVMPAASDQAVYFYHLEVCDHHDCRKECFKGRVFPMSKPSQEIIDQEEYLCLSELILKTVKKTTPLKIVVTIWQLKPAFTLSS